MPLTPGQKLGSYEIVSPLGEGGMGEVYRARDSKLKREVAIKVLPADVAEDRERLARFQREAEVLASLNHPHIAHVYGIEEGPSTGSGQVALVMELVEGEDLSQRIARGPIPLDEALPIARQIAEALEAAHDHGVIHRDLKPANIKVRPDGTVKVLDFGLAKSGASGASSASGAELANSPTITTPAMTMHGMILGTAAYMAPEQAKGKLVDRRADIWAFGCVLYEMLTGQRTFAGDDVSDTLVSILRDDPRWAALPANTPPHVRLLLRRCLQRDPQKRLPHIGTARLELADGDTGELVTAPSSPRSWWLPAALGAVAGAVLIAALMLLSRRPLPASEAVVQFAIEAPIGSSFPGAGRVARFAISPDGQDIVYQVEDGDKATLRVRRLTSVDAITLPGTETERSGAAAQQAFWSPDSRFIGFFDEEGHQLKKLDRQSGILQVVAGIAGTQLGGSWNNDGVILMSSVTTGGVQRVPAAGGGPTQVTTLDESTNELSHLWPDFFDDGKHFVYLASYRDATPSALFVGSLDGGKPRRLFDSPAMARAAAPDFLICVRNNTLVAQRLDLTRMEPTGDAIALDAAVNLTPAGRAAISVSRNGTLVYGPEVAGGYEYETRWVDRQGRDLQPAPAPVTVGINGVRLSPDGTRLAYSRQVGAESGVWIQDTVRAIETRVAGVAAAPGATAVFSPDGSQVMYRSFSNGVFTLLHQPISGVAPAQPVFSGTVGELLVPYDWSNDGQSILMNRGGIGADRGLWIVAAGDRSARLSIRDSAARFGADLSPDGRLVAYASGNSFGGAQIFVQTFPASAGGKWPVSALGGSHPRWSSDGRQIYFIDGERRMMVAPITTTPQVEIGAPIELFNLDPTRGFTQPGPSYPYDVSSNGQRFVLIQTKTRTSGGRLVVTTNWQRAFAGSQ